MTVKIERLRHEIKRRNLTVKSVTRMTPSMLRVLLTGEDLGDFHSGAPDDHIKLFLPSVGEPARRDYTPRCYNVEKRELAIDFAIHDAGPATRWAQEAVCGSQLTIGGPRGSTVIDGVKRWLLIGDETALPAIGRRIEEMGASSSASSVGIVVGPQEEQVWETRAEHVPFWVHRPLDQADKASKVIELLDTIAIEPETFAWIAAEASVARALRNYLVESRCIDPDWIKAAGYWAKGKADAHERIEG